MLAPLFVFSNSDADKIPVCCCLKWHQRDTNGWVPALSYYGANTAQEKNRCDQNAVGARLSYELREQISEHVARTFRPVCKTLWLQYHKNSLFYASTSLFTTHFLIFLQKGWAPGLCPPFLSKTDISGLRVCCSLRYPLNLWGNYKTEKECLVFSWNFGICSRYLLMIPAP